MSETAFTKLLFGEEDQAAFAILDGAAIDGLLDRLYLLEPDYQCLYRGDLAPDIAEVAPYLVQLSTDSAFTDWLLARPPGSNWGIYVLGSDLASLKQHFRRFLIVHNPDGKPLYFRFYDPRVLRIYLLSCNTEELNTFFGPVRSFIVEGEDPNMFLIFRFENQALRTVTQMLEVR